MSEYDLLAVVPRAKLRAWRAKLLTIVSSVESMNSEAMGIYGDEMRSNVTDNFDNILIEVGDAVHYIETYLGKAKPRSSPTKSANQS